MKLSVQAICVVCFVAILGGERIAHAQLPVTQISSIFPLGAQQGTTVDLAVSGGVVEDVARLVFSHPGIKAEVKTAKIDEFTDEQQPVYGQFQVTIADDVPAGVYDVRAIGRFGVSNPRKFVVDRLNEVIDNGQNRSETTPQELAVGDVVNGRVEANSGDYYQVALKAGQLVTMDCQAKRIDSRLDPLIVIRDEKGNELARSRDVEHDAVVPFQAPHTGKFLISVQDHIFGGGSDYGYRLSIHQAPHILVADPPMALPGRPARIRLLGWNLPGGKPTGIQWMGIDLRAHVIDVQIPETGYSLTPLLPSATALNQGLMPATQVGIEQSNQIAISLATAPVIGEPEPNDDPQSAQQISLPAEIAGSFYPAADDDWYEFHAEKGKVLWVEAISERLGSDCDPYLAIKRVVTKDGKTELVDVTQADDPSDRNGGIGSDFDITTDDPSIRFTAPETAAYRVMVRDQFGSARADPRARYRLVIRDPVPDFDVLVVPQQIKVANGNQVLQHSLSVRCGGKIPLRVSVRRHEGFEGEIRVVAENLPAGVSCQPLTMGRSQSTGFIIIEAASDASDFVGPLKLTAQASLGDQTVERNVRTGCVLWGTGNRTQVLPSFRSSEQMNLAVIGCEQAVASIDSSENQVWETSLGGKLEIPVKVTRKEGYKENFKLVANGLPNELKPKDITINGDKSDGNLAFLATNARAKPGLYTFYLRVDTKQKHSRNPAAIERATKNQQRLDGLVKSVAEELKASQGEQDAAHQQFQAMDKSLAEAASKRDKTRAEMKQKQEALQQAESELASANQRLAANAENEALKKAAEAANQKVEQTRVDMQEGSSAFEKSEQAVEQLTKEVQSCKLHLQTAQDKHKESEGRSQRVVALKKKADGDLNNAKKNYATKDVNIALVSSPITVRVAPTPIAISVERTSLVASMGGEILLPVTIKRKYGFADNVDLALSVPKGVSGISAAQVSVPKESENGALVIKIAKNAKPIDVSLTIRGTGKFNNVNVSAGAELELKLTAPDEG